MSSTHPGFRPVSSALRTPRAASPPKTVTFSDTNVVHHLGRTSQSSRHDDTSRLATQHLKEIITGVDEGKGRKRRDRRRLVGRMPEARVRNARKHGELNFGPELTAMLYAFGDDKSPLPETVRVLDEIITDFIIETCHQAARAAHISGRQKVKVDDFKFAIRGDELMLGRVRELLNMDKWLKEARKQFNPDEADMGEGGGKGRKRKRAVGDEVEEK